MKKGQANIIVVILTILIVLAAAIILWNVVNITVEKGSDEVTVDPFKTKLEIVNVHMDEDATFVMVRVLNGAEDLTGFKFSFYDSNNNFIADREENLPKDFEVGYFAFTHFETKSSLKVDKVSVFPMFGDIPGFEFDFEDFEDNRVPGDFNQLQNRYCDHLTVCMEAGQFGNPPLDALGQFKCDIYSDLCYNPSCGDGFCDPSIGENSVTCPIDCEEFIV